MIDIQRLYNDVIPDSVKDLPGMPYIYLTSDKAIDNTTEYFPPLNRPLQRVNHWWLSPSKYSPDMDCIQANVEKYRVLLRLAMQVRPYLVAEIGCGYGNSLWCIAQGAQAAGQPAVTVNGYDPEVETPGCLEWAREWFMQSRIPYNLSHSSSRQYDLSGIPLRHIDLFHVDGSANAEDVDKDLLLVPPTLSDRGIVVVSSNPAVGEDAGRRLGFTPIRLTNPAMTILER